MTNHQIPFGRATRWQSGWQEKKFFGHFAAGVSDPFLPYETKVGAWKYSGCQNENYTFHISGTEVSVVRFEPPTSLSYSEIVTQTDQQSAANSIDLTGQFAFEVTVDVAGARGYKFRMDSNDAVEVIGSNITIELLGPTGTTEDPFGGGTANPASAALAFDTLISPSVMVVESNRGKYDVQYSERFTVPAATQSVFIVPAYAKELTVHVDGGGAGPGTWTGFLGSPDVLGGNERDLMTIDFGTNRQSRDNKVGSITHLQTDSNVAARDVELIWTVRP